MPTINALIYKNQSGGSWAVAVETDGSAPSVGSLTADDVYDAFYLEAVDTDAVTISGAVTATVGQAVNFTGSNYLETGTPLAGPITAFTVACRLRFNALAGTHGILGLEVSENTVLGLFGNGSRIGVNLFDDDEVPDTFHVETDGITTGVWYDVFAAGKPNGTGGSTAQLLVYAAGSAHTGSALTDGFRTLDQPDVGNFDITKGGLILGGTAGPSLQAEVVRTFWTPEFHELDPGTSTAFRDAFFNIGDGSIVSNPATLQALISGDYYVDQFGDEQRYNFDNGDGTFGTHSGTIDWTAKGPDVANAS